MTLWKRGFFLFFFFLLLFTGDGVENQEMLGKSFYSHSLSLSSNHSLFLGEEVWC